MAATEISGRQIKDGSVQRKDLDVTTTGQAVIRQISAGSGISLSWTGADTGTGDVTITATGAAFQVNDTWIQWRNAADTLNLPTLKVDSSNNVILNADANAGAIYFQIQQQNALLISNSSNLRFYATNFVIQGNSVDNSDNQSITLTPANATSLYSTRGANVQIFGNEHASNPGQLILEAGNKGGTNLSINAAATDGNVQIQTAGTNRLVVGATNVQVINQLQIPSGSASAPSIFVNGSATTGLFSPTTNTVAISTAGTERVRVDASGNVGIGAAAGAGIDLDIAAKTAGASPTLRVRNDGTATGAATLSLFRSSSDYAQIVHNPGGGSVGTLTLSAIRAGGDQQMHFRTGTSGAGTLAAIIDASQNVGIGEFSSIGAKLQISTVAAGNKGLIIKGVASQSANLLEIQNSSGTVLVDVEASGALDLNNNIIKNVATPVSAADAATKGYVDSITFPMDVKNSCRVATTANITLSGTQTIDGVSVVAGDRVLVKNQTIVSDNGIYVVAAGAWSRSADADSNSEVTSNMFVFISEGTTQADTQWVLTANDPITLGSTNLTFAQFGTAPGTGLNTLNTLSTTNQSFATGSAGTDFSISSSGSTHTFNLPDASFTARGLITTGAQTIAGRKSFSADARPSTDLNYYWFNGAFYPLAATNGTRYNKVMSVDGTDIPLSSGVTDSGYRIALALEQYVDTANFAGGTLAESTALWARTGSNGALPSGTITNAYAVKAQVLKGTNVTHTNAYGFYEYSEDSNSKNYMQSKLGLNTTSPGGQLHIVASGASAKGLIVQGAASQSANLLEVQNSSGTVLFSVDSSGSVAAGTVPVARISGLNLDSLSDVVITTPSNDQVLKYNGTSWVNSAAPAAGATDLDGLSDVVITTPTKGQFIVNDGTNFINSNTIEASGAAIKPLIIKAAASQSANLLEIQNSSGTGIFSVSSTGRLFIKNTTSSDQVQLGFSTSNNQYGMVCGVNPGSGFQSTYIGAYAGQRMTGDYNTAVGTQALWGQGTATGTANIGLGGHCGYSITTGSSNTLIGYQSGYSISSGGSNVAIGNNSGYNVSTGTNNVFVGTDSGSVVGAATNSHQIAIGSGATTSGDYALAIGRSASAAANCLDIRFGNAQRIVGDANGQIGFNEATPGSQVQITSGAAARKGLIVKGAASQTANLLEVQDSSSVINAAVSAAGAITTASELTLRANGVNRLNLLLTTGAGIGANLTNRGFTLLHQVAAETQLDFMTTADASSTLSESLMCFNLVQNQVGFNTIRTSIGGQVHITTKAAARKGLIVQGAASQSANLLEVQNSSGTALVAVESTGAISLNNQLIKNVATPVSSGDVATKGYVDSITFPMDVKNSCRVATTANITLSGTQTIDGVAVVAGDRVLVKNQTTGSENGIYVVAAGAWSRAADADSSSEVTANMFVFVSEGTSQADSQWVLTTNDTITLGTTSLTFAQFGAAAGSGIATLNTLSTSSQTFATGTAGTNFAISSTGSTHTFNIPDASATARGLITTAAQTIAGIKTFSSDVILGSQGLRLGTSAGTDNGTLSIVANGSLSTSRSGGIFIYGINHATAALQGATELVASNVVTNSLIQFTGGISSIVKVNGPGTMQFTEGSFTLGADSTTGNDTKRLRLTGAGYTLNESIRGAFISLHGNNHATEAGNAIICAGTGTIVFSTNSTSPVERMRIASTGLIGINEASSGAQLQITAGAAATKGLIVKSAASQTANLLEVQDSSGTALVLVNSAGDLVFNQIGDDVVSKVATGLAGTGTVQAGATAITSTRAEITTLTSGSADAFVLPTPVAGKTYVLFNRHASVSAKIFPASGHQIDSLGANAAYILAAGQAVVLTGMTTSQWYSQASAAATIAGQQQQIIDDFRNNTNVTEETFGNFNALTFPNSADARADFPLPVSSNPTTSIVINVVYVARGAVAGNVKFNLNYNLLQANSDASVTTYANSLTTGAVALVAGDQNKFRTAQFTIPLATLNTATAPFQIMAQLQRDTAVASNYGANVSVIGVFASGLGSAGGYSGGNLSVSGQLISYSDSTPAANAVARRTFRTTTTNATTTTIATIPVTDNSLGRFSIKIAGHNTSISVDKNFWSNIEGAVRRRNGGTAGLVGTRSVAQDSEGSPGYTADVSVSGNNLLIQVTGAAAETVVWAVTLDYQEAV